MNYIFMICETSLRFVVKTLYLGHYFKISEQYKKLLGLQNLRLATLAEQHVSSFKKNPFHTHSPMPPFPSLRKKLFADKNYNANLPT